MNMLPTDETLKAVDKLVTGLMIRLDSAGRFEEYRDKRILVVEGIVQGRRPEDSISHLLYYDAFFLQEIGGPGYYDAVMTGRIKDEKLAYSMHELLPMPESIPLMDSLKECYPDFHEGSQTDIGYREMILEMKVQDVILRYLHQNGLKLTQGGMSGFRTRAADQKKKLLGVIHRELPTLDEANLDVNAFVAFLKDDETQKKRRRMFSWQNTLENEIEKGSINIEQVPDMIAERIDTYLEHLKLSEMKFKYGTFETIVTVGANVIAGLTLLGLPSAIENLLTFINRPIALIEDELKAPAREIAYIVHATRKADDWVRKQE